MKTGPPTRTDHALNLLAGVPIKFICAPSRNRARIQAHLNLKAIGTQHGGVTGTLEEVLKKAGKKPGDIVVGGIDLAPATISGLKSGHVSATLDQLLHLQGFVPVVQCVMTAVK
jgi:simple sugar transport system substrate-binding protein